MYNNIFPDQLFGFSLCETPLIIGDRILKQFRYPLSKKKRIRKKFAKDKANFKWFNQSRILVNTADKVIYCNKETLEKFTQEFLNYYKKHATSRRG